MSKTNTGLIAYAEAQLGLPYWFGTFGNEATEFLYQSNKKRLPAYYTASDFQSQYGKRVHDCIGLIKGYLWSDSPTAVPKYASNGCPDTNAEGMYQSCKEKGVISTLPEVKGMLLFVKSGSTMEHVGVYIGNGLAIEAKGHAYGVVKTEVKKRTWTHWGKCPYLEYETEEDDMATIIEKIAESAGITVEETISGLGVLAKFTNKVTETWETEGVKFLIDSGLINTDRDPREPVEFGELGVILSRLDKK
jgi:hypothetical protein